MLTHPSFLHILLLPWQSLQAAAAQDDRQPADEFDAMRTKVQTFNTFARLPYVNCFAREVDEKERFDIGILGAPHDISVTVRPGARFGPSDIRSASLLKSLGYSVFTGRDPFRDWAKVIDCGDVRMSPLDKLVALRTLDRAHEAIADLPAAHPERFPSPRVLMLGGDHSTTLSALRSARQRWGKVSVVHFDSHIGKKLDHGTFLYVAHEENLILNSSIHVGIRAPHYFRKDETNDKRCGFETITAREIDTIGIKGVVDKIRRRIADSSVYVTVDIDVLDPAFAPATGTPEPGGWTTRELLSILHGLEGLNVIGSDVVEVAPAYDSPGQTTALTAGEVVMSLMDLMVASAAGNASTTALTAGEVVMSLMDLMVASAAGNASVPVL
ncbi:hypothetical protein L249_8403 [Ophiocordyceps polyrhachis-furcata BCC 54312]|uniref:Arginase n=1 Tax=Ophiocordyceps polyrhachis-furcata BCC 54312 TaxID=1330021 RepID=A0A367L6E8_9HYPO|nr:hypothetical protein L249_8403 [Ophiocordyceps polyrhachis-furcata BCC 54312]